MRHWRGAVGVHRVPADTLQIRSAPRRRRRLAVGAAVDGDRPRQPLRDGRRARNHIRAGRRTLARRPAPLLLRQKPDPPDAGRAP
eukprot:3573503-Rhodomonas_salina.1